MGPIQKNRQPKTYARPTGLRASRTWQVFLAFRRHDMVVWLIRIAIVYLIFFIVVGVIFLEDILRKLPRILDDLRHTLASEQAREALGMMPVGMILLGFILLFSLFLQLVHAKQYAIPQAIPKILRTMMVSCLGLGLLCAIVWSWFSWVAGLWGLGVFGIAVGMPLLVASFGKRLPAILFVMLSYGIGVLFAFCLVEERLFDTPSIALVLGAFLILATAIRIWQTIWHRFCYTWTPVSYDLLYMQAKTGPFHSMRQRLVQGREDWLSRWIDKERERRVETVMKTSPQTLREQIRFFRAISCPPRFGLAIALLFIVITPCFWLLPSDFNEILMSLLYLGLLLFVPMTGMIIVEWRQLFASETLLPLSRRRYVLVASVGRLQNFFAALAPFLILLPILVWIRFPNYCTPENTFLVLLIGTALITLTASMILLGVILPIYVLVGIFTGVELFFVCHATICHRFLLIDIYLFTVLCAALIPLSLWRLCRIEPGRVGKR